VVIARYVMDKPSGGFYLGAADPAATCGGRTIAVEISRDHLWERASSGSDDGWA
jgi:hypothetical protein